MNGFNIGDLRVKLPIIQGGMGVGISLSGLASAVANEGGIGVISAVGIGMIEENYRGNFKEKNKIALRKEIRKARLKTDGIIGVNLMLAVTDFDDLLNVALEEKIDVVFMGAGLPLRILSTIPASLLENSKTKFVPKVSSAKAAKLIFQYWLSKYNRIPDAIVIEGPKAGGHLGYKEDELKDSKNDLESIIKETISVMKEFENLTGKNIPVIAAGGIYSGQDVYNALEWGASAVKMGSKFVTTHECDADIAFKESYLNCKKEDIVIIKSPVGLPGRVIKNKFVEQIMNGLTKPVNCPWKCLKTCNFKTVPFCIAEALFSAAKGDLSQGFSFIGEKGSLATSIKSVKETILDVVSEYYEAVTNSVIIKSPIALPNLSNLYQLQAIGGIQTHKI